MNAANFPTFRWNAPCIPICQGRWSTFPTSWSFRAKVESKYMSSVLEEFPNWHARIESRRGEDVDCCGLLEELRDRIARESPMAPVTTNMCRDVERWLKSLTAQRRCESQPSAGDVHS
jgi:hypothetical protein